MSRIILVTGLNVPHFFETNEIAKNISSINKELRAALSRFILKIWIYFRTNFFSFESIKSPLLQAIKAIYPKILGDIQLFWLLDT